MKLQMTLRNDFFRKDYSTRNVITNYNVRQNRDEQINSWYVTVEC